MSFPTSCHDVACPTCGSDVKMYCVRDGKPMMGYHLSRHSALRIAALQALLLRKQQRAQARDAMYEILKRCPATSPGGSTDDGQLPRKGAQCGLPEGHDGEHSILIPTGSPWARSPSLIDRRCPIGFLCTHETLCAGARR